MLRIPVPKVMLFLADYDDQSFKEEFVPVKWNELDNEELSVLATGMWYRRFLEDVPFEDGRVENAINSILLWQEFGEDTVVTCLELPFLIEYWDYMYKEHAKYQARGIPRRQIVSEID